MFFMQLIAFFFAAATFGSVMSAPMPLAVSFQPHYGLNYFLRQLLVEGEGGHRCYSAKGL